MTNQNKAHAVNVGSVYKPMGKNGSMIVANDSAIINHFCTDATGNLIHAVDVCKIGYNVGSKKPKQCPAPEYGGFVLPSFNLYARNGRVGSQALGVWARSNPPDCLRQFRAPPPFFIGGNQSKKPKEGIMPKKSTVAIATSKTQSNNSTQLSVIDRALKLIQSNSIDAGLGCSCSEITLDLSVYAHDAQGEYQSLLNAKFEPYEFNSVSGLIIGLLINEHSNVNIELERLKQNGHRYELSCRVPDCGFGIGVYAHYGYYTISASFDPKKCDAQWWIDNGDNVFSAIIREYEHAITYMQSRPDLYPMNKGGAND